MTAIAEKLIPLGWRPGVVSFLASEDGLHLLPKSRKVLGQGNGGLWEVEVPIQNSVDLVAMRLCGVGKADLLKALYTPQEEKKT